MPTDTHPVYEFGPFRLEIGERRLLREGQPLPLRAKIFDTLCVLVQRSGHLVAKEELMEAVWPDSIVEESNLTHNISVLRKTLGRSGEKRKYLETVPRRGYRFVAEVREIGEKRSHPLVTDPVEDIRFPSSPYPLVQRDAELGHLRQWLDDARNGRRQMVFVTGEPGLGKTTLVDAFIQEIRKQNGIRIGRGQCLEQRSLGEAYMPVLEALGRMCRETDGEKLVSLLARQAPTWLVQMPWLTDEEQLPLLHNRVLGVTRERMLREMVEALEIFTAEMPLLFVLEDLHWSDDSTVDLISWLARRREPARLLVLGTYRPADLKGSRHPLHSLQQELRIRGHCSELALTFLTEEAVSRYVKGRFPESTFPKELSLLLWQRTRGNPLFVENLLDSWISRQALVQEQTGWSLTAPLQDLEREVPENARQLIEQQLNQLPADDQEVLETASVVGTEFSAATLAAILNVADEEIERQCATLARQNRFVRAQGTEEWPNGTVSDRFVFIHDLYQQVLYERVPAGRKVRLHKTTGLHLEKAYGPGAPAAAVELAMHFVRGREPRRAVPHLLLAAEQSLRRSAYAETVRHLTTGLELLRTLPETVERDEMELNFQVALAPALVATRGWASPQVEDAYLRARDLCDSLQDPPQRSLVRIGLASMHELRGEFRESQSVLERHLDGEDADLRLESHELLACSMFHQAEFESALEHANLGLTLYHPSDSGGILAQYGDNAGVSCHNWAGLALWFLGYPDRALEKAREALTLAAQPGHLHSLAIARSRTAVIHQFRRELEETREWSQSAIELASEQGFPWSIANGIVLQGWAMAIAGDNDQGIRRIQEGMLACRQIGVELDRPFYLALLAEAHALRHQMREAFSALDEAQDTVRASRTFFYEAELCRLRGEILLRQDGEAFVDKAAACFHQALELSRQQKARSLELRAAISLFRLEAGESGEADARQHLLQIRDWFTEGFRTPDFRHATSLLKGSPVSGDIPLLL